MKNDIFSPPNVYLNIPVCPLFFTGRRRCLSRALVETMCFFFSMLATPTPSQFSLCFSPEVQCFICPLLTQTSFVSPTEGSASHVQRLIRGFEFRRRPSADAVLLARKRRKKRKEDSKDASNTPTPNASTSHGLTSTSNAPASAQPTELDSCQSSTSAINKSLVDASSSSSLPSSNPCKSLTTSSTSPTAEAADDEFDATMEDVDEGFEENLLVVVVQRRSHEKVGMGLNIKGPSNDQRPINGVFVEVRLFD